MVLQIAPRKKKNNSGNRSKVMLLLIKIKVKAICINRGVFRWEMSESITLSTFPNVRSK